MLRFVNIVKNILDETNKNYVTAEELVDSLDFLEIPLDTVGYAIRNGFLQMVSPNRFMLREG